MISGTDKPATSVTGWPGTSIPTASIRISSLKARGWRRASSAAIHPPIEFPDDDDILQTELLEQGRVEMGEAGDARELLWAVGRREARMDRCKRTRRVPPGQAGGESRIEVGPAPPWRSRTFRPSPESSTVSEVVRPSPVDTE